MRLLEQEIGADELDELDVEDDEELGELDELEVEVVDEELGELEDDVALPLEELESSLPTKSV